VTCCNQIGIKAQSIESGDTCKRSRVPSKEEIRDLNSSTRRNNVAVCISKSKHKNAANDYLKTKITKVEAEIYNSKSILEIPLKATERDEMQELPPQKKKNKFETSSKLKSLYYLPFGKEKTEKKIERSIKKAETDVSESKVQSCSNTNDDILKGLYSNIMFVSNKIDTFLKLNKSLQTKKLKNGNSSAQIEQVNSSKQDNSLSKQTDKSRVSRNSKFPKKMGRVYKVLSKAKSNSQVQRKSVSPLSKPLSTKNRRSSITSIKKRSNKVHEPRSELITSIGVRNKTATKRPSSYKVLNQFNGFRKLTVLAKSKFSDTSTKRKVSSAHKINSRNASASKVQSSLMKKKRKIHPCTAFKQVDVNVSPRAIPRYNHQAYM